MEPRPATPAPGTASNATKDSGTLAWVEGGHRGVAGSVPSPQSQWVGMRGQVRCVCHGSGGRAAFLPLWLKTAMGPSGQEGGPMSRACPSVFDHVACPTSPDSLAFPGSHPSGARDPDPEAECLSQLQEVLTLGTNPWGQGPSSGFSPKPPYWGD